MKVRRAHAREAGPRRDDERLDPAVADLGGLDQRVEQGPRAGLGDEPLPGDLEVLGEVGHAGAGAVRVRPLHDRAQLAQRRRRRRRRCRRRPCGPTIRACRSRRTCRGPRCSCRRGTAGDRSSRTEAPARAAAIAAVEPAEPDPTTQTSTSAIVGRVRREGHGAAPIGLGGHGGHRPAAVDLEQLAGHGTRLVRQEVDGRLGDLVGVEHLAGERLLAAGVGEDLRVRGRALRHRRLGQGRRHDVDPDAVGRVGGGHRRHERGERALGRGVGMGREQLGRRVRGR